MRLHGFGHAPGTHCGSTSLRNLATYHGWGFDESTCFGLASGLGFNYREPAESPHRMFVGRPIWLERAFFDNLGIETTDRESENFETAWAEVRERLDGGDPVMAFVDLYYLDYYDTSTHFAPHSLLLVGYDEDADASEAPNADPDAGTGVVYTSDSEFEEVQSLPLSSLRAAWASDAVVPLSNRYLVPEGDPTVPVGEATERAIRTTATYMLDPEASRYPLWPGATHGLAGIRALADDLPSWTELPDPGWTARFAYQNVERRGTGGGAFRGLYAPFLASVEEAVGLEGFGDRMHAIAEGWTAVGGTLREASEADDVSALPSSLESVSESVHELADGERTLYEDALAALGPAGPDP
jgi:hypothetical protein